jgi:hypothetical protein
MPKLCKLESQPKIGIVDMSNQKWKHHNAYRHGLFSRTTIVPGESPEEFEALHSDLVREWMPDGATEEDAVLSIAEGMWRKRRVQQFIEFQFVKNISDPGLPTYDERYGLSNLVAVLRERPEFAFKEYAKKCLTPDLFGLLQKKCPRANFKSAFEWAQAVIHEIETVLLPERKGADRVSEQALSLFISTAAFTEKLFDQELMLEVRIDAMIDRAVKRLIQTKAMKQMLGQSGIERNRRSIR